MKNSARVSWIFPDWTLKWFSKANDEIWNRTKRKLVKLWRTKSFNRMCLTDTYHRTVEFSKPTDIGTGWSDICFEWNVSNQTWSRIRSAHNIESRLKTKCLRRIKKISKPKVVVDHLDFDYKTGAFSCLLLYRIIELKNGSKVNYSL